MRLTEISEILESALNSTGYVNSVYRGSPYDLWNNKEVDYVSACYDVQQVELQRDVTRFQFMVYVADRLVEGEGNAYNCLDYCQAVIERACAYLRGHVDEFEVGSLNCNPFMQKFADNLAGYYTTLTIEVRNDIENC